MGVTIVIGDGVFDKTIISSKPIVTAASADIILVGDASDSDNLKKVTAQSIADLASAGGLVTKSEKKISTDFSGNPKKATVDFVADYGFSAFADADYSVTIVGVDNGRIWVAENMAAGSFVINSNSNSAITGDILWTAVKHGES